jgi:hypothetical protein
MAVFPFYDVSSLSRNALATIRLIAVEANAVAHLEESGLFTSHLVRGPKTPRLKLDLSVW